ncbi:F-box/FBD/LRR-repeat protein At3g52680 [Medicago truncatula]|uniref:F-box/FBD/LRR-repeat protein At3g52680 n=1 Tax=Medicago truncatula TaxID=3880 RepID=UPI0019671AB4|nr:F-box/FBD/LRR-repeat protein At3g52680 [Medicago truncatula]
MSSPSLKKRRMKKSSLPVDRISDLPDSILFEILYFLPTKLVVTTSVLSKRWKHVWLSVLALDFDSGGIETSDLFLDGVHSTMYRRDITLPIHSFRFKSRDFCIQNDINQFVYLVLQRGIQNLCLDLYKYCRFTIELPATILSCRTLKVLKLRNLTVGDISQVDIYLPSLKTLHLHKIDFKCYEHLKNLLLGCPVLEDLETTKSCFVANFLSRLSADFIALPSLIKARICELHIPFSMVCKAEILRVERVWMLPCYMQFPMFESLTHLELSFNSEVYNPKWKWLMRMLKLSPKLQNLIIKWQDNEDLEEKIDECWKDPPNIPECLSSQLKTCRIRVFKGTQYDLQFAIYIMENSKVLETMRINSIRSLDINEKYQLLAKLSSSTRGSTTCKLLFN